MTANPAYMQVVRAKLLAALLAMITGCDQIGAMDDQPRVDLMEPSSFFADGSSARPLPAGTVPRDIDADTSIAQVAAHRPLITMQLLEQGRQGFEIYCQPCHGRSGYGNGIVVQRGYPAPPSLHDDRLRGTRDEYLLRVLRDGLGKMPAYRDQVPADAQWPIVAYLRALQLSQHAPAERLPSSVFQNRGGAEP